MQAQEKEWLAGWLAKMTATEHQGSLLAVLLTAALIMTALLFAPVSCNVVYVSNTAGNKSCHGYHQYNLTCPSLNLALLNGIFIYIIFTLVLSYYNLFLFYLAYLNLKAKQPYKFTYY